MPDLLDLCQRTLDDASSLISSLSPDDLAKPTPCSEWDVRGLVTHMIGVVDGLGGSIAGEGGTGEPTGDDLGAAYKRVATRCMSNWRQPGALERTISLMGNPAPAPVGATVIIGDQCIHTWDLATALGRDYAINPESAAATLELLKQFISPERRGPGQPFSAELPCAEDAPLQQRLLAFAGRQA